MAATLDSVLVAGRDPLVKLLRELPDYETLLIGWPAIRDWTRQLGVCPPHGPTVDTMRRWRQRESFPVLAGENQMKKPQTSRALVVAWLLRRGREA